MLDQKKVIEDVVSPREDMATEREPPTTTSKLEPAVNGRSEAYKESPVISTSPKKEEIEMQDIDLEKKTPNEEPADAKPKSQLDPEVYEQLMKDSEPIWITDMMVANPCLFILGGYLFLFAMGGLAAGLDFFKLEKTHQRDFLIWDKERTEDWDRMFVAEEYLLGGAGSDENKPLRLTEVTDWNPLLHFRSRDGETLIQKERLIKIRDYEQVLLQNEMWKDVCLATSTDDTSCSPAAFVSCLAFMPMAGMTEPIESYTTEELQEGFNTVFNDEEMFSNLALLFQRKDFIEGNSTNVSFMRSFVRIATPLEVNGIRYKSLLDEKEDQKEFIRDFALEVYDTYKENEDDDDVYPQIMSQEIVETKLLEVAEQDTSWAVFSITFVFLFFIFKLKSSFLAMMGIGLILLSFGLTQVVNEGVFRNTFFNALHNVVVFIVLGIGADNIFVYTDGYMQTKSVPELEGDKRRRLAYAFKRSARATATTSSTTSVAFLANAFSPIMPIQSFGIYAAIIIAANYLLVVMIYPSVVLWWEDNVEGRCCPCQEKPPHLSVAHQPVHGEPEYGVIEMFFGGPWNDFVKKFRYPIIVIFAIIVGVQIGFAAQLSPLSQSEEYVDSEHEIMEIQNVQMENFDSGGILNMDVDIYWGAADIDKSGTSMWDPSDVGTVILDDNFDLSSEAAQQSLMDFCEDLPSRPFILNKQVTCWMDQFEAYATSTLGKPMPLPEDEFPEALYTWATTVTEGKSAVAKMQIGFQGEKLILMKVEATSLGDPLGPYDEKKPIWDEWEAHLANFRRTAPASMQNVYQHGYQWWAFMDSEKAFMSSAFQGMGIATFFAYIVLIIATRNIIQATLSLICVVSIMATVLGIMQLKGWEIGVSESLAMVILIGFSVDYTVHLSADYMHAAHQSRHDKIKQAYTEMGVSIMSGAIVTCGSGVFLFGGVMLFFQKFALMVTSTITMSFLVSMLLFGALMHAFGPEDGFGDVCKSKK